MEDASKKKGVTVSQDISFRVKESQFKEPLLAHKEAIPVFMETHDKAAVGHVPDNDSSPGKKKLPEEYEYSEGAYGKTKKSLPQGGCLWGPEFFYLVHQMI